MPGIVAGKPLVMLGMIFGTRLCNVSVWDTDGIAHQLQRAGVAGWHPAAGVGVAGMRFTAEARRRPRASSRTLRLGGEEKENLYTSTN